MKLNTVAGWLVNKKKVANTSGPQLILPAGYDSQRYAPGGAKEARPFIQHDVPFLAQKHINMCGEASAKMLLQYHGRNPTINLDRNPRGLMEGTDVGDLARRFGLVRTQFSREVGTAQPTAKQLAWLLAQYGPLLCSGDYCRMLGQRWGHVIVLTGIWDDLVLFQDSWHGEDRRKPLTWFVPKLEDEFAYLA